MTPNKGDIRPIENSTEYQKWDGKVWRLFCLHKIRKSSCERCAICTHGNLRSDCDQCPREDERRPIENSTEYQKFNGKQWRLHCTHGRMRTICKDCGGSGICEHGRQRTQCKECGGSGICEHGRRRSRCKDCGGSEVCEHGRQRRSCTECPHKTIPSSICKVCLTTLLSPKRIKKGICAGCDSEVPERTEKTFGNAIIEAFGYPPNARDETMASGSSCRGISNRRPDLLWIYPGKVAVVVEIDEDSHFDRESSCELTKLSEQNESIQLSEGCECIPVYTIRVNPDAYDGGRVSKEERAEKVAEILEDILHGDHEYEQNGYMKVIFCYYHSKSRKHVDAHIECGQFDVEIL